MTPYQINHIKIKKNNRAYTLIEILIATGFTVLLLAAVTNFYTFTKKIYSGVLSIQPMQDSANIVLNRIIQGGKEPSGVVRLEQGVSYCIGTVASTCNPSPLCPGLPASTNELHYCGLDGIERWYRTDGTSLIYHHPTALSSGADEVVYKVPTGATMSLFFVIPTGFTYAAAAVKAQVVVSQVVNGRTVSGSAVTMIGLRNHPS